MSDAPLGAAIAVRGLEVRYGAIEAVRGVDFEVQRGEVFALLGPNGAGKTTTIEVLEGFTSRSAGEVRVLGEDPGRAGRAWRERIGVVLQESQPDPGLTVGEAMALYAGYYSQPRGVNETLEMVGLDDRTGALATTLSGGQRRRLDVGLALIGRPQLLFLDEPTTGFDPAARRDAWSMIERLRDTGTTIVLTTHAMEEAARLADRIAIIAAGRMVATGPPASIGGRRAAPSTIAFRTTTHAPLDELPSALASRIRPGSAGCMLLQSERPVDDLSLLAAWARRHGGEVVDLEVTRPSLEDVYLALTTTTTTNEDS